MQRSLAIFFLLQIIFCTLSAVDNETEKRIIQLAKSNPNQFSALEYLLIANALEERGPCNLLVFGVGKDSSLWVDLNHEGLTVFLEDDPKWLNLIKNELKQIHAYLVRYHTQRNEWKKLLLSENQYLLEIENLPDIITNSTWDIILVDGPTGYDDNTPGRMQSIYTAAKLAQSFSNCSVFVHDCNREVEAAYSDTFLQDKNLQWEIDRLRHYLFQ